MHLTLYGTTIASRLAKSPIFIFILKTLCLVACENQKRSPECPYACTATRIMNRASCSAFCAALEACVGRISHSIFLIAAQSREVFLAGEGGWRLFFAHRFQFSSSTECAFGGFSVLSFSTFATEILFFIILGHFLALLYRISFYWKHHWDLS